MSHLHRFHLAGNVLDTDMILLPESEAHHALRVARLRSGEEVELFDGAGKVLRGEFEQTGKRDALVRVTRSWTEEPPAIQLTLLQAMLHKPDAVEELLRRGTEVGVTRFAFFKAARSELVAKPSPKWDRILAEVCKQCGRNWLPQLEIIDDAATFVSGNAGSAYVAAMTPDARPVSGCNPKSTILLAVGPEGDFTPAELEGLLTAGATPITLGAFTYRAEVAAVLGATLLLHEAGAFDGTGRART